MTNVILFAVLAVIVAAAATYIYKAKKRGVKCVGCPAGAKCGGNCSGSCGSGSCGCHGEAD